MTDYALIETATGDIRRRETHVSAPLPLAPEKGLAWLEVPPAPDLEAWEYAPVLATVEDGEGWALEWGHATTPVVDFKARLTLRIKGDARVRILAIVPEWKQFNLIARGVELTDKLIATGSLTTAELAERDAIRATWQTIKAIRTYSDTLEAAVTAATTQAQAQAAYDAATWPE